MVFAGNQLATTAAAFKRANADEKMLCSHVRAAFANDNKRRLEKRIFVARKPSACGLESMELWRHRNEAIGGDVEFDERESAKL